MESKTPICDRWEYDTNQGGLVVPLNVAKDLEIELAEARAEIEYLKAEIRDNNHLAARQIVPAEMAVDDLQADIEHRDKLIEQMREALKKALRSADAEWESKDQGHDWADACETMRAALEAAERGE